MVDKVMDEMQTAYRELMKPGDFMETPGFQRIAARFDGAVGGIQTPLNQFSDQLPNTQSGARRRGLYIPHGTNEVSDVEVDRRSQTDKYPPEPILGRGNNRQSPNMGPAKKLHWDDESGARYLSSEYNQPYGRVVDTEFEQRPVAPPYMNSGIGASAHIPPWEMANPNTGYVGDGFQNRKPVVMPDKYDGTGVWQDYITQFEMCAEINTWNDRQKATFLAVSLRGAAQQVLGDMTAGGRQSYEAITEALSARFGYEGQTELFRVQLKSRLKKSTETFPELAQSIRRLVARSYPQAPFLLQQTLAKEHFIDALTDSDMRLRIQQSKPHTVDEAVKLSIELEAFQEAEKQRIRSLGRRPVHSTAAKQSSMDATHDDFSETIQSLRDQFNQLNELVKGIRSEMPKSKPPGTGTADREGDTSRKWNNKGRRRANDGKCWACGELGHYRHNCPKVSQQEENC